VEIVNLIKSGILGGGDILNSSATDILPQK